MTIRIIGMGQAAAGDDGVGMRVVQSLQLESLGAGVELHTLSDASALVSLLEGVERVIIVDAAVNAGPPGHVRVLSPEALESGELRTLSTHGLGVLDAIALARTLLAEPAAVQIVAVAIERPTHLGSELSPAVRAAIPNAQDAVRKVLAGA